MRGDGHGTRDASASKYSLGNFCMNVQNMVRVCLDLKTNKDKVKVPNRKFPGYFQNN